MALLELSFRDLVQDSWIHSVHTPFPTFLVIVTLRIVASRTLSLPSPIHLPDPDSAFRIRFASLPDSPPTPSHASSSRISHTRIFTHGHIHHAVAHSNVSALTQCLTSYESRHDFSHHRSSRTISHHRTPSRTRTHDIFGVFSWFSRAGSFLVSVFRWVVALLFWREKRRRMK